MKAKYKLSDFAKDLNVPSEEIMELLKIEPMPKGKKKSVRTLDEKELSMVFEYYTQKNAVENFDEFFSYKGEEPKPSKKSKPEKTSNSSDKKSRDKTDKKDKKDKKVKTGDDDKKATKTEKASNNDKKTDAKNKDAGDKSNTKHDKVKENKNKTENKANKNKADANNADKNSKKKNKRAKEKPAAKKRKLETIERIPKNISQKTTQGEQVTNIKKKSVSRVVDTRNVSVNIDKYNERYDVLASEKIKTDYTVKKQKINQRSQRRGKPKSAKHETEAERLQRIAMQRKAKPLNITVPEEITVGELALRLKATAAEVIKKLMMLGTMAGINDVIDFDTASLVSMEFNARVEKEVVVTIEERIIDDSEDDDENLLPRAPVVVVMGHVDHGKTSLLDVIRHTSVTSTEAGGITQHIGAYRTKVNDKKITFLDTPGHEAFTTMRARGAQVTDVAILVVAADDGIMPQTVEAINHAKAAGVSIIVAINKIDKDGANIDNVKNQLTEYELVPEEWGGDIPCVPVSAKTKQGIQDLLEMVALVSEMKELKANPDRAGKGTVIEARLDKGRGPIATVLVQNGTMRQGDIIVAGTCVGRVRAMTDEYGHKLKEAGPSVPVEITGLNDVPNGGDVFNCVSDEKLARALVEQRKTEEKEAKFNAQTKVTLDNLFDQMQIGEIKELKIIVKADVQGSVEAVKQSLEKLTNDEVRINIIHGAVGAINESDVMLANASDAIIVGFNVRPDAVALENAERDGVDMRLYRIIYDCIEEIQSAMKGMLAPKFKEKLLGQAECRQVYKISNVGSISGSYVTNGKITRTAQVRVVRDGIVIFEDKISSLKRFKDDVKEVAQGYECGIGLEKFNDIKEGDIFEAFVMEEYRD